jgi:hypothetical protein
MHAMWGGMPAVVEEKCLVLAGKKGRIYGGGMHAVLLQGCLLLTGNAFCC